MKSVSEAFGRSCIPKFLQLINDPHVEEETKIQTLTLLENKLHDPMIKEEVEINGGIEIIGKLLFLPYDEIVALGCKVIEALCSSLSCRKHLILAGGVRGLLHAIESAPIEASSALKKLVQKESMDRASIEGILETIKKLLSGSSSDVKTTGNILEILTQIAEDHDGLKYSLESEIPALVCALMSEIMTGSSHQELDLLMDSCSGYLMSTSMTHAGKQSIREGHGIKVLGLILEKNEKVLTLIKATGALMLLSVEVDSKKLIIEHCFPSLMALLGHEDVAIAHNVKTTFCGCCEDRELSLKIQTAINSSEIEKTLGTLPTFAPVL